MPGTLVHQGAIVQCAHQGLAQPTVPNPRVRVSGQPIILQPFPWTIAGCTLPPPPAANGPCVTAQWLVGSVRVKSMGMPILLRDSQAICTPTGTPLSIKFTQVRVKAI
ncbi:MAG: hypothetical protein AAGD38_10705 [Acidobacteriota bacterium]